MAGRPAAFEQHSIIDAPVDQVWARVVTPEGINDELRPWLTMSVPRGAEGLTVDNVPVGAPVGRCWMRLFGVLPIDYDLLTIEVLQPGRGFHEESTMMSMRRWRHERSVTADGDGKTVVQDRITFTLRALLRPLTPVFAVGLRALFGHRHRRLQRHFAGR
jgi:ligand-binding SRPBCC domain-containing protein